MSRNFLHYHTFHFFIRCVQDLHVGSGNDSDLTELRSEKEFEKAIAYLKRKRPNADATNLVAMVERDYLEKPFIPGSGIKGVIRAKDGSPYLLGRAPSSLTSSHSIDEGEDVDMGEGGNMFLSGGTFVSGPDPSSLPFWDNVKGTYIDTHIAISPDTETVKNKHLFMVEYVPAGTVFKIEGIIYGDQDTAEKEIKALLTTIASTGNLKIGGKQTKRGAVCLEGYRAELISVQFNPIVENFVSQKSWSVIINGEPEDEQYYKLTLTCDDPFIIRGSLGYLGKTDQPDATFRRRNSEAPAELTAEAVRQKLRRICAFLERTQTVDAFKFVDEMDCQFGPDDSPKKLTSTQRLFGVKGFAGQVEIGEIANDSSKRNSAVYEGIAVDDFTGGVMNGAVMSFEGHLENKFTAKIWLNRRELLCELAEADKKLFEALLEEVAEAGIKLGGLTGTGNGWFDAKVELPAAVSDEQSETVA